jgi:hypothetical protein
MPVARHCRHCWGDCPGDCLMPGEMGLCIHKPNRRLTNHERMLLLVDRRFWRRVFWGVRSHRGGGG